MAEPVATRILQAVLALVEGAGSFREVALMPPGDPAGFPAAHVLDEGEEIVAQDWLATRSLLRVAVIGFVADRRAAHLQARRLDSAIVARLLNPSALSGLATQVTLGSLAVEVVELADVRTIGWRREFTVDFSFQTTDPALVAG